jgi:uncharacterized membrane protein YesL
MLQLNFVYMLFCLPIVTFGPASAAYTYVLRNFAREEHAFVWLDFRDAFKKYWKKGFLASLFDLIPIYVLAVYIFFYSSRLSEKGQPLYIYIFSCVTLGCALIYLFMRPYMYTMIVTFNLRFREMLKNALIFSVVGLIRNVLSTALGVLLIWGSIRFVKYTYALIIPMEITIPLCLLVIPFTIHFISIFLTYPVIKKYMIDPQAKPDNKSEDESIFKD